MTNSIHEPLAAAATLSLVAAACAATGAASSNAPQAAAPQTTAAAGDRKRGIDVDVDIDKTLGLDHSLEIRKSLAGIPHELRDGDTLRAGDRIVVYARTSMDAYLYLVFCSKQKVTVYPPLGGIRAAAGEITPLPTGTKLVVDAEPGIEILYVVASTAELTVAEPKLAATLAAKQSADRTGQGCGPSLDALFAATSGATSAASPPPASAARPPTPTAPPPAHAPKTLRGSVVAKRPLTPRATDAPGLVTSAATAVTPAATAKKQDPGNPDFVRYPGAIVWYLRADTRGPDAVPNGEVAQQVTVADSADTRGLDAVPSVGTAQQVTAADSAGIAVVRHEFIHVAQ